MTVSSTASVATVREDRGAGGRDFPGIDEGRDGVVGDAAARERDGADRLPDRVEYLAVDLHRLERAAQPEVIRAI